MALNKSKTTQGKVLCFAPRTIGTRVNQQQGRHRSRQAQANNQKNHKNRLLTLPAELRNRIYHFALVKDQQVFINIIRRSRQEEVWITEEFKCAQREPALLRTCHQIRSEATSIYYRDNAFFLKDCEDLRCWLKAIGEARRGLLKDVRGCNDGLRNGVDGLGRSLGMLRCIEEVLRDAGVGLQQDFFHKGVTEKGVFAYLNESSIMLKMTEEDWAE